MSRERNFLNEWWPNGLGAANQISLQWNPDLQVQALRLAWHRIWHGIHGTARNFM